MSDVKHFTYTLYLESFMSSNSSKAIEPIVMVSYCNFTIKIDDYVSHILDLFYIIPALISITNDSYEAIITLITQHIVFR